MKATAMKLSFTLMTLLAASASLCVGTRIALAVEPIDVPTALFGMSVGKEYSFGGVGSGDVGNLPIKKVIQIVKVGPGIDYYFEPRKVDGEFTNSGSGESSDAVSSGPSFSARFYPVIPAGVATAEELEAISPRLNQRMASVQWSKEMPTKNEAAYRVIDLCETYAAGFDQRPLFERSNVGYACRFVSGDYEFKVGNSDDYLVVMLGLRSDIRAKLEYDTDTIIRRLQAKKLVQQ